MISSPNVFVNFIRFINLITATKQCAVRTWRPRYLSVSVVHIMAIAAMCISGVLMGCSNSNQTEAQVEIEQVDTPKETLTVLAGSELKDLEPLLPDILNETGVNVVFNYVGTLDGVSMINQGDASDAAWFSHGKYLSLANRDKIKAQHSIMLSPVVMGIKKTKAKALDWLNIDGSVKSSITWQSITDASQAGVLRYAMTNPAASNSGFTALMGAASALAGTSDAPTTADIAIAKPKLKAFFRGQALTSGSSGWLAEAYVNDQDNLDAMINYESVLLQLNASGELQDPLVLVYPKEGIVTADYPFILLNFNKKDSYDKVVAYLNTPAVQQRLMVDTKRRPVNNQVVLSEDFYKGLLIELPFPNSLQVIDDLLFDFANELRNPAFSVFLLDVSGSMRGDGITQLKQAMLSLAGGTSDTASATSISSNSARFTQFSKQETVALKPFDNRSYEAQIYSVNPDNLNKLRSDINSLQPKGGTAIFDALLESYETLYQQQQQQQSTINDDDAPRPYYSIVLMSDGVNEDGIDYKTFVNKYQKMPPQQQRIKTFVILFGDADEPQMQQLAQLTGGRTFDGRHGNLSEVFRTIRGYQ